MTTPTFAQLKKTFLDSGYEIRLFPRHQLEGMALDAPSEVKRHLDTNIMGLIIPDQNAIGIVSDLNPDERASTLLHEWIHLWDETIDEQDVESMTIDLEETLNPNQFGFLQFLAS